MSLNKLFKVLLTIFVLFFSIGFSFAEERFISNDPAAGEYLQFAGSDKRDVNLTLNSEESSEKISYLKEITFSSGYAQGKLNELNRYKLVPISVRFGFDLDPFLAKFNFKPKGITELIWEPIISSVFKPNSNVEIGLNWLLKYAYPLTEKFYPYLAGGAGIVYMSQHTREQGTQFNFTEQAEVGLSYFLEKNISINVGVGFRHLSNSSIKRPNHGINTKFVLGGVSYFF